MYEVGGELKRSLCPKQGLEKAIKGSPAVLAALLFPSPTEAHQVGCFSTPTVQSSVPKANSSGKTAGKKGRVIHHQRKWSLGILLNSMKGEQWNWSETARLDSDNWSHLSRYTVLIIFGSLDPFASKHATQILSPSSLGVTLLVRLKFSTPILHALTWSCYFYRILKGGSQAMSPVCKSVCALSKRIKINIWITMLIVKMQGLSLHKKGYETL